MFFLAARNSCPGRSPTIRPMLETLEDRLTPSGAALTDLAAVSPAAGTQTVASLAPESQGITFAFSPPNRLILSNNQTTANLAVTLTNTADGSPLSDGTVTFTITNRSGTVIGQSITANLSSDGKATAAYGLPANLPIGPYTITAVYHNAGSPHDGASGSELLSIVLPAIPVVQVSPGSGQASAQTATAAATPATPSLFDAALTLYLDGVQRALNQLIGQPSDALQASIDANLPYAGPWGSFFEMAGETAVFQAVHASL